MQRAVPFAVLALLAACGAPKPVIVQTPSAADTIRLARGFATQIELPDGERAISVAVGDQTLVRADADGSVISLAALASSGETNVIVRSAGDDGRTHVHQYRLTVSGR